MGRLRHGPVKAAWEPDYGFSVHTTWAQRGPQVPLTLAAIREAVATLRAQHPATLVLSPEAYAQVRALFDEP